MKSRVVTVSALFVAAALTGCGSNSDSGPASIATTTTIRMTPITAAPEVAVPTTLAPVTLAPTTMPPTTAPPAISGAPTVPDTVNQATSTPTAASIALVLRDNGLGDAAFGDDADQVIQYVTSILGSPTDDSGWADPLATFGVCPGTEVRGVTWNDLQLLFGDESVWASGTRHFFNYVHGPALGAIDPPGMRTEAGIGVGTKVADLRAAYPAVEVYPEEIYGPYFVVNENLTGFLTGVTDADTIISFIGGIGCGE